MSSATDVYQRLRKEQIEGSLKTKQVVVEKLSKWDLYETTDTVICVPLEKGFSIGYWKRHGRQFGCYFDLNTYGQTLYLLHLEIQQPFRGCGHGRALYHTIEEIALTLGCTEVRQTPSGKTVTGKTRAEYLQALGYTIKGFEAVKELRDRL